MYCLNCAKNGDFFYRFPAVLGKIIGKLVISGGSSGRACGWLCGRGGFFWLGELLDDGLKSFHREFVNSHFVVLLDEGILQSCDSFLVRSDFVQDCLLKIVHKFRAFLGEV